ncbi:MAG: cellulase family glycosylhydrolase [Chloroflexota bacterium]|nr:cellulase family glycosylhydrolase [Chloroflexota bacterium]
MPSTCLNLPNRCLPLLAVLAGLFLVAGCATASAAPKRRDFKPPTASVLSATSGNQQVALSWTAASDNVGVTRYEVVQDGTDVASLDSSARSYTAGGLVADEWHSFEVVAYDAAGNSAVSNTVTAAASRSSTAPPPSAEVGPAPFPSRLKVSGRRIVDENGYTLPTLKGFNIHVGRGFTWPQSHFNDIAAAGGRINRAVLHWDDLEPSQGVISSTDISNLDAHVQRAAAAGIYTLLELHLNTGDTPSWTAAAGTETERYSRYGQYMTQFLANRYGNPASPQYTKSVIGFGLNEPPLDDSTIRDGNNSIPYLEGKQRQMISWMRAPGHAPSWIGFVAYGYATQTPIYDDATQNPDAVDASPTAYDSVGGNVIIDVHDYVVGCSNTDVNCEGRQWNGTMYPSYQGGPLLQTADSTFSSYTSSTVRRSQQVAFLKPYKTFSTQANIPVMLGEWGWPAGASGEQAYINDKMAAWAYLAPAIEIQWNYDAASNSTVWAARPGGVWRSSVSTWLAG